MERYRGTLFTLFIEISRCLACRSCELACAVEHSTTKELAAAIHEEPRQLPRVRVEAAGNGAVPLQCRQCVNAPCIEICPTKALHRVEKETPVFIKHELCIGCRWCIISCPFGVIQMDSAGRSIIKCDECFERVSRQELPACVSACPTMALQYKSLDEILKAKREAFLVQIERSIDGGKK